MRTVVSQLFARHSRPEIILKYPFTKDDMGCGYVSWICICAGCSFTVFVEIDRNLGQKNLLNVCEM